MSDQMKYIGKISFDSLLPLDKKKNEFTAVEKKEDKKKQVNTKQNKKEDILPKNVGYIEVEVEFTNDEISIMLPPPAPPNPTVIDPNKGEERFEEQKERYKHTPSTMKEFEERQNQEPLPVCLFLHVLRAAKISDRVNKNMKRNIYIQHKIYGTPDDISSSIFWNQSCPEIDHRMIIPLNRHTVDLMKEVPLTISVWDKRDNESYEGKDEFIGMVNLNLKPVFSIIGSLDAEEIKTMMGGQDMNMIEFTNKYHAIHHISSADTTGMLKIYLALGNIHQVNHYNKMNPGNNSRLLGIDPMSFDPFIPDVMPKKRDRRAKKKIVLHERERKVLDRDPAVRHLLEGLIDSMNDDSITPERFEVEVKGLMDRIGDVDMVEVIKGVQRECERCNPFEEHDMSRKNYLHLGSHQLQYNKATRKYQQIYNEGEVVIMDKCYYSLREEREARILFVDPTVVKVRRNDDEMRVLSKAQMAKLKKYGKYHSVLVEEEVMRIEKEKERKRLEKEIVEDERKRIERELYKVKKELKEREKKKKENEAIDKEMAEEKERSNKKALDNKIKIEDQRKREGGYKVNAPVSLKLTSGIQLDSVSSPMNDSNKNASPTSKGWNALKSKLSIINKEGSREEEDYQVKSQKSIHRKSRMGLDTNLNQDGLLTPKSSKIQKSLESVSKVPLIGNFSYALENSRKVGPPVLSESQEKEKFEVLQVGMVLNQGRVRFIDPSSSSSNESSEEIWDMKNINLVDNHAQKTQTYDYSINIKQIETDIEEGFQSKDMIHNFTIILEYMRRFIFQSDTMKKNLKELLLGLYQSQMVQYIEFSDLEYIMENYQVQGIGKEELDPLFNFLDFENNGRNSLQELHESLTSYISLYKKYHLQYEGSFNYILDKILQRERGYNELIEYLMSNHSNYHVDSISLSVFIRDNYWIQDVGFIDIQLNEYGEFLYFDKVYIFNLINMITFLKDSGGHNCDPQLIKGLHSYDSFLPLILNKVRSISHQQYGEDRAFDTVYGRLLSVQKKKVELVNGIEESKEMSGRIQRQMSKGENSDISPSSAKRIYLKFNFVEFSNLMVELGLSGVSVYERMVIFKFIHDLSSKEKRPISRNQRIATDDIKIFFQVALSDDTEEIERLLGTKPIGSLASFINREKIFDDLGVSLYKSTIHSNIKNKMRDSKLVRRRKMNTEPVETDRLMYRITMNIQGIEGLDLPSSLDYCDFSVSFSFPGEKEAFESQLFNFIPREKDYDILLNTEHTYRCTNQLDLLSFIQESFPIRVSLFKIHLTKRVEAGFALIPFSDIVHHLPQSRRYFLVPSNSINSRLDDMGSMKIAFAYHQEKEKITQKEYFMSKRFIVQNQPVEKSVIFERDVPKRGFLVFVINKIYDFNGLYELFDFVRPMCDISGGKGCTIIFQLRVSEYQKPKPAKDHRIQEVEGEEEEGTEQPNEQDGSTKLFDEFQINVKSSKIGSTDSLFTFIDELVSKKYHYLFQMKKYGISIDAEILSLLESSDIEVSLWFCVKNEKKSGWSDYKVCGTIIPAQSLLTIQNINGVKIDAALVQEERRENIGRIDMNLNYTKVFFDDAHIDTLNKFQEAGKILEELKTRDVHVDLSKFVYMNMEKIRSRRDSVFFLQVRIGPHFVHTTGIIEGEDRGQVSTVRLNNRDHRNIVEYKMANLVEELDVEKMYEEYRERSENIPIEEFIHGYIPRLKVYLIEKQLNGCETELAGIAVDMRHVIKVSMDPRKAQKPVVNMKAVVPFEILNKIPNASALHMDTKTSRSKPSGGTKENIGVDSYRLDSARSWSRVRQGEGEEDISDISLCGMRLWVNICVTNSSHVYNRDTLKTFKVMIGLEWMRDHSTMEKTMQKYGYDMDEIMIMGEKGFMCDAVCLKRVVSKEMEVSHIEAGYVVDMLGNDGGDDRYSGVYMLQELPILEYSCIENLKMDESEMMSLFNEMKHLDEDENGYTLINPSYKVLSSFSNRFKLTFKQMQAFRCSELIRDVKEGMSKRLVWKLDKEGFDSLVMMSELNEYMRKVNNKNTNSISAVINFHRTLENIQVKYDSVEKNRNFYREDSRLSSVKEGSTPNKTKMSNPLTMIFRVQSVDNISAVSSSKFPSTSLQIIPSLPAGISNTPVVSKLFAVCSNPQYQLSITYDIDIQKLSDVYNNGHWTLNIMERMVQQGDKNDRKRYNVVISSIEVKMSDIMTGNDILNDLRDTCQAVRYSKVSSGETGVEWNLEIEVYGRIDTEVSDSLREGYDKREMTGDLRSEEVGRREYNGSGRIEDVIQTLKDVKYGGEDGHLGMMSDDAIERIKSTLRDRDGWVGRRDTEEEARDRMESVLVEVDEAMRNISKAKDASSSSFSEDYNEEEERDNASGEIPKPDIQIIGQKTTSLHHIGAPLSKGEHNLMVEGKKDMPIGTARFGEDDNHQSSDSNFESHPPSDDLSKQSMGEHQ